MTESSEFCKRLKEERKKLGLTQAQAGDLCGVRPETWNRYENGGQAPGMEVLAGIAKAGADVGFILTGIRTALVTAESRPAYYDPRREAIMSVVEKLDSEGLDHVADAAEKAKQIQELKHTVKVLEKKQKGE